MTKLKAETRLSGLFLIDSTDPTSIGPVMAKTNQQKATRDAGQKPFLIIRVPALAKGADTSLTEELARRREASRNLIPPDKLAVMDRATAALSESGITVSALGQGDTAPEFVLPNATQTGVSDVYVGERTCGTFFL